jgi:WD40 repeat protein
MWSRRNKGWTAAIVVATASLLAFSAITYAQGQEARRGLLMQRLTTLRLSSHVADWSAECWELVRRIKQSFGSTDPQLQAEAAASLIGIDAKLTKAFNDFHASDLVYDATGQRLLMVGEQKQTEAQKPQESRPLEEVRIWDSTTDQLRTLPQQSHDQLGPIRFGDDGTPLQLVWEKEERGALLVWDLERQKALRRFEPATGVKEAPKALSITRGGTAAAAILNAPGGGGLGIVWETKTTKVLREFPTKAAVLELSPDASLVATSDSDGHIIVWPVAGGEPIASLRSSQSTITCLTFARDYMKRAGQKEKGWLLAAGSLGGELTIWDVHLRIPRAYCRGSAHDIFRVAFSPDGMTLASTGRDKLMLWDLAAGRAILGIVAGPIVPCLAFATDGRSLAIGAQPAFGSPGAVKVWALGETRGEQSLRGLGNRVVQVRHSPDGRYIAALAQGWQLAVWEVKAHRLLHVFETPKGIYAESAALAFDPAGNRLALATSEGARMWDVRTGEELRSWPLQPGYYDRMAFPAPDRLLLIRQESVDPAFSPISQDPSGRSSPRVIRVRNLLGPEPLKALLELKDFPTTALEILIPPDGRTAVMEGVVRGDAGAKTRVIKAFDSLTGGERWSRQSKVKKPAPLMRLIDPTGRVLVMADDVESGNVEVELATGRLLRTYWGNPKGLSSRGDVAVSVMHDRRTNDGRWVASLLRLEDEAVLMSFAVWQPPLDDGWTASSTTTPFGPDDQSIAWGNVDGTVTVFDIQKVRKKLAEVDLGW